MTQPLPEPPELTPEELQRITKRRQHAAQARVLEILGIPYMRHPLDGSVLVGREALRRVLAGTLSTPGDGRPDAANSPGIDWSKKA